MRFALVQYLLLAVAACYNSVWAKEYEVVSIPYTELSSVSRASELALLNGLTNTGIVTVSDIPNFSSLRKNVLKYAALCSLSSKSVNLGGFRTYFEDGVVRSSLGAKVTAEEYLPVKGLDSSSAACSSFEKLSLEFRKLVSSVSDLFVDNIDAVAGTNLGDQIMKNRFQSEAYESVSEIVKEGEHLEHFHTYQRITFPEKSQYTMDMHVDLGLFIAMTPGLFVEGDPDDESGLYIELKNGEVVKPNFGNGDVLIFMIGDGFKQWINPSLGVSFRATPHAMRMPKEASTRTWYGRMFLPPKNAFLVPQAQTFRELQADIGTSRHAGTACSDGLVISERSLQGCDAETEIYCWTQCRSALSCASDESTQCVRSLTGSEFVVCDPDIHDSRCAPTCIPNPDNETASSTGDLGNGFCNGFALSMYMAGFTGVGDPSEQCLIFLFPSAVLDSGLKYVFASFASILLGVLVEVTVYFRRKTTALADGREKKVKLILLYSAQVTLGYLAMLVAMTYSILLFFMIILGLTLGHSLLNLGATVTDHKDPCCGGVVEMDSKGK
mmetsp:Transcript_7160/g.8188  ORF Transcript_7160/g.8188 Transcript_7160/m.8188 type:complete len:553 (+) Transcript_7160:112-1770(+)|eukprot:CAMPEP_0184017148 /NCGR_PEP_ID=MMETSP0954-20121128/7351_1 /TAXON_ID=627963 /ORGANISM="Aplanochytrium sp, Strain PBS07" /LENGTH=552 /DNA_ID=CAMNT_0026298303 /DNA_START=180 /DNA_END=1838 /DNA_ORIENTATION=+